MIKIGVLGYGGRMGQLIAEEIAANEKCALAGGVVRAIKPEYKKAEGILITSKADEVVAISDMVIDFTAAEATPEYVHLAAAHKKPFVSGTTGLTAAGHEALQQAAAKIPVFYAANTSVSLVAMKQIAALAAKLLGDFDYDVAIIDEHHRLKKDAPSGTAKALGDVIGHSNGGRKVPSYSSVRAGAIVGEHEVIFAGHGETIRLRHSVTDRRIFARGAVEAALWLVKQKPGLYGMEDVLGLKG